MVTPGLAKAEISIARKKCFLRSQVLLRNVVGRVRASMILKTLKGCITHRERSIVLFSLPREILRPRSILQARTESGIDFVKGLARFDQNIEVEIAQFTQHR
jgi:hypothetical protein